MLDKAADMTETVGGHPPWRGLPVRVACRDDLQVLGAGGPQVLMADVEVLSHPVRRRPESARLPLLLADPGAAG
ncbi:hypothetical protein [Streptomyces sp. SM10]|uniref:hypothetical protein n=1 Tax=Streptomyces sp. SM10 TaxID=565556 RepID=UPI0015E15EDA